MVEKAAGIVMLFRTILPETRELLALSWSPTCCLTQKKKTDSRHLHLDSFCLAEEFLFSLESFLLVRMRMVWPLCWATVSLISVEVHKRRFNVRPNCRDRPSSCSTFGRKNEFLEGMFSYRLNATPLTQCILVL